MKVLRVGVKCAFVLAFFFTLQSVTFLDDVIGTWEYTAEDIPPEYSKGEILISNADDSYKVVWSFQGEKISGQNVIVDRGEVRFTLDVDDTMVKVSLNVTGDTFEGKAIHYDGVVILSGKRKK